MAIREYLDQPIDIINPGIMGTFVKEAQKQKARVVVKDITEIMTKDDFITSPSTLMSHEMGFYNVEYNLQIFDSVKSEIAVILKDEGWKQVLFSEPSDAGKVKTIVKLIFKEE